jgi:hypothetical protein
MKLPNPPTGYDRRDQAETRVLMERADYLNHKRNQDVEIGAARLVLTSANGTRFSVVVSNAGVLSATAI